MQEFLAEHDVAVAETVHAGKAKLGREDALRLARAADRVIAARGKSMTTFDMKSSPPDDETLARALLGPSGNLRAPTVRVGRTLLVGFNADEFAPVLAGRRPR